MDNNIIITVGRQIGSGGSAIAQLLAAKFDAKLYDREILNLAARESGFCEEFFEENDERKGFFKSLQHFHFPLFGRNNIYPNDFSQESLYLFQCDAIRKAAAKGSCVFVGRTADYVLRDMANVVNVFITASMDSRVAEIARRRHLSSDEAQKYITEGESRRASYYNYYTGKRWGHSESYDLCIDSCKLGLEATADFIADYVRQAVGRGQTTASHE
mgnify:FL=1